MTDPPPSAIDRDAVVWLVDDSPIQAELARQSLAGRREVRVFHSAAPMLECLATDTHPDLLILDWQMPELSGLAACRFVRTLADGGVLPIVVLTASADHDDLVLALEAGANDFLRKPIEPAELEARVASLVRGKRLHEKLVHAENALRAEGVFREEILAMIAHDLRQPLNTLVLGSSMLADAKVPDEARARAGAQLGRAAARMNRMIEELMTFSRARARGPMPIESEAVDLEVLLRDVVEELRVAHPEHGIALRAVTPCRGHWDPHRLAQVVSNLVENAIAHGSAGTTVDIGITATETRACFWVENRGETISAELLQTIFDPFRRGARTGKRSGLGLGLYIVARIVAAHAGAIDVASADGLTRFTVTLPLGPAPS